MKTDVSSFVSGDLFAKSVPEYSRLAQELEQVEQLLSKVLQLKSKHLALLPKNIQELSRMLTSERGELSRGYLQSPAHLSAYVCYFLPWNLHRLASLLHGLALELPDRAQILDLGSGPLTFPLALWLARPDLRGKKLTFVCSDRSKKVMSIGADLLRTVMGDSRAWRIELRHTPLEKALEQHKGKVDLLSLCNVLNEIGGKRGREGSQRVQALVRQAAARLASGGRMFVVEPGTRVGGGLVELLRQEALSSGFSVLAPCTHQAVCPLLDRRRGMWCHFTFKTLQVSPWLGRLTRAAGLEKEGLSLSFSLLGKQVTEASGASARARIISQAFKRPGRPSAAYACGPDGLLLLEAATPEQLWPGRLLEYTCGQDRDAKSGALLARQKS